MKDTSEHITFIDGVTHTKFGEVMIGDTVRVVEPDFLGDGDVETKGIEVKGTVTTMDDSTVDIDEDQTKWIYVMDSQDIVCYTRVLLIERIQ